MTTPSDSDPGRTELARQWARALRPTAYAPTSHLGIERLPRELLDNLFKALAVEEFSPNPGRAVGQRLVAAYFTGEQSLSRTVEVLGRGLPADPELRGVDGLAGKVTSLLGAVAAGYAAALQAQTLDQQEEVKQALLKARQDAERGLRVSEAEFRQLFTSSAVGLAISDLDGTLLEANQALSKILGDPAAELAGRRLYELFHPHDVAPLRTPPISSLSTARAPAPGLPQWFRLIDDALPCWEQPPAEPLPHQRCLKLAARTVAIAPRVVQRVVRRPGDDSAVARAVPLVLQLVHRCGATVIVRGIDTRKRCRLVEIGGSRRRAGRVPRTTSRAR